jgi:hypothetical protein
VTLLAPEALDLDDGEALHADLLKRLLHLVELEGLDDGLDLLHGAATPEVFVTRGSDHFPKGATIR